MKENGELSRIFRILFFFQNGIFNIKYLLLTLKCWTCHGASEYFTQNTGYWSFLGFYCCGWISWHAFIVRLQLWINCLLWCSWGFCTWWMSWVDYFLVDVAHKWCKFKWFGKFVIFYELETHKWTLAIICWWTTQHVRLVLALGGVNLFKQVHVILHGQLFG